MRLFRDLLALGLLMGCGGDGPIEHVTEGARELQKTGAITAGEAVELAAPSIDEVSRTPVLVLITSGTDVTAEGRSRYWELVYHFPDRSAQAVYSFEATDIEREDAPLRLTWRISPRSDTMSGSESLPVDFVDSPEAARRLAEAGVDWIAGDPDLTLATKRLSTGDVVWAVESYGTEFTTPFVTRGR